MEPPKPVRMYDYYHCDMCKCRTGKRVIFDDGTEEFTCEDKEDCFGLMMGYHSYELLSEGKKNARQSERTH